ncbi:MAG: O-antigen ligase family protein [Syntrophobacteraceae bacterium]
MTKAFTPFASRLVENRTEVRLRPFGTQTLLPLLIAAMLGGLFQVISQLSRFSLWGIWLLMWWLIVRTPKSESLGTLSKPAWPFAVWLVICSLWGAIVSPIWVLNDLVPDLFRFFTSMMVLSLITKDRDALARLANFTPLILIVNLMVTYALSEQLPIAETLLNHDLAHAEIQTGNDRYAGLWGNANVAGMDVLVLLVLSAYGRGLFVWLGRAAGVMIIYFSASRTATYLLLLILLLLSCEYLHKYRRARWAPVLISAILLLVWTGGTWLRWEGHIPENSKFSRVFDPLELDTQSAGGLTRLDVIKMWFPVLREGLWYGYGYGAMGGGGSMGEVFRTDIPYNGIHNMYIGTWVDTGFLGGLSFIGILGLGLSRSIRARLSSRDRTVVLALWAVALIFGCFAHSLQAGLDGQILYLLCYLLPGSKALSAPGPLAGKGHNFSHGKNSSISVKGFRPDAVLSLERFTCR